MNDSVDKQELIKRWRRDWIFSLFEFTHIDFQRKLWIETAFHDIIGSYGEDMCQYFDDLFLDDNYNYQIENKYISIEEHQSIKDFHKLLAKYDENGKSDSEILVDNSWIEITSFGLQCWDDLKEIIRDIDEIEFINEIERKYLIKNAR